MVIYINNFSYWEAKVGGLQSKSGLGKITESKKGCEYSSSGRAPTKQARGPKFRTQITTKTKQNKEWTSGIKRSWIEN
jgi:hypothetical protein